VASWLVHLTLDQAVQVEGLDGDTVLCSWARNFILTVSLSTQVNKWVSVNLVCRRLSCNGLASHPGGSRNTPNHFMLPTWR